MNRRDFLRTAWDIKLYQICKQDGYRIGKLHLIKRKLKLTPIYENPLPFFKKGSLSSPGCPRTMQTRIFLNSEMQPWPHTCCLATELEL